MRNEASTAKRFAPSWLVAVAAVLCAAPILAARYLPFCDLPEHVAAASVIAHYRDAAWGFAETFDLAFSTSQYLLYHLVVAGVTRATSDAALANRLVLAASAFAFPYALRSLLRAVGRDPRLAVFAPAAFWSRPLFWGFLPYIASIPVLAVCLAQLVRYCRAPTWRRAWALAGLGVVLFYLHVSAYMVLLAVAPITAFVTSYPETTRGFAALRVAVVATARKLLWAAPSAAAATAWVVAGHIAHGASSLRDASQVGFLPLAATTRDLPRWSHDVLASPVDDAVAAAVWGAFLLLLLGSLVTAPRARLREELVAVAPFVVVIALYFTLPFRVAAGAMLNLRIATMVVFFAPLAVRRAELRGQGVVLAAVVALHGLLSVVMVRTFRLIERDELGNIDALLANVPPRAKLATLSFRVASPSLRTTPWPFLASYLRASRGVLSEDSFQDVSHWPIHYKPSAAPPTPVSFWSFDPCVFRNARDGAYFDYVLARGTIDPFRDAPPGPAWKAIGHEKDFTLFARVKGGEGATWPAWSTEDRGPCESRWSLEHPAGVAPDGR